jgi:hypothetical protein
LIDPLSEKESIFKSEITNLAQSLHQEGRNIEVVYSGRQDENYGICADMSLIMLQELIEQYANKPILDYHKQTIIDNLITTLTAITLYYIISIMTIISSIY